MTPNLKSINKLSRALDVSIDYLFNYKDLPENNIGQKIKKYRLLKGWSQKELAENAGLNPSTILKIEQGLTKYPSNKTLKKIFKTLK
ncbi:MAG: helix-turn-helix transcriptional regulator [Halanaerobiaceae bacterium]|nr:helix-turn-helix transcriptional regulator [Halanaerobiaceae bacterium]